MVITVSQSPSSPFKVTILSPSRPFYKLHEHMNMPTNLVKIAIFVSPLLSLDVYTRIRLQTPNSDCLPIRLRKLWGAQ